MICAKHNFSTNARADSIMILSVDKENKTMKLVSLMLTQQRFIKMVIQSLFWDLVLTSVIRWSIKNLNAQLPKMGCSYLNIHQVRPRLNFAFQEEIVS